MTPRATSQPPALAGYTPIELVGTGGYADVFLYEQHMPNRKVAVKVLISDVLTGDVQRRQFTAEANTMAKVSTHPYIVSIFHADVASDGRPYIVMEYYPGDNYLRRARREQFGVAEVLRVGVQVGSALETAHRAGILHRDIKPANILTSEFRRPGLADFGIASAQGPDAEETEGVSIPWSPPEAFGSAELGVTADVYSLAATLYHLLAGRSPYEVPGGDNSALGLMSRIERGQLPPLGRPDVPASLERLLAQAMAKNPQHRPTSVVAFLRQIQGVEAELKLAVTPLELADDGPAARSRLAVDDEDATRVKGVTQINAQVAVAAAAAISSVPANPTVSGPLVDRRREGLLAEPEVGNTIHRPAPPAADVAGPEPTSKRLFLIGALVVAGLAAVGTVGSVVLGGESSTDGPSATDVAFGEGDGPGFVEPVASPANLVGLVASDGSVSFSWDAPGRLPGDVYEVKIAIGGAERSATVSELEFVVDDATPADGPVCVKVTAIRQSSEPSVGPRVCVTL